MHSRYNILSESLSEKPDAVLLDGMFLINLTPLRQTETLHDYSHLIFRRFIQKHFRDGASEVHLLFDTPQPGKFNPKASEQHLRDVNKHVSKSHTHTDFLPKSSIPRPWREYIECRECKRSIVKAIGLTMLTTSKAYLNPDQQLILAGCFSDNNEYLAMVISGDQLYPLPGEHYNSTALESDQRIWRHAFVTSKHRLLIYSPDTDVYNIGLGLFDKMQGKHVVIQINVPHKEPSYLDLNLLRAKFYQDTDLSCLPRDEVSNIMQMAFVVTGCDYLSYFCGIGKATFLTMFFQHAGFITGIGYSYIYVATKLLFPYLLYNNRN